MKNETLCKALILSKGVVFDKTALVRAVQDNAKMQNMSYNIPDVLDYNIHPQELLIKHADGYETVVSCTAPLKLEDAVYIKVNSVGALVCEYGNYVFPDIEISFVRRPDYYLKKLSTGELVCDYITACGFDELNIIPWSGCAISHMCAFCGTNVISSLKDDNSLNALELSINPNLWEYKKTGYLERLLESLNIAKHDSIYSSHMHVIMISGNLSQLCLELEAKIYAEIAHEIKNVLCDKLTEGIIAVITPPPSVESLINMKYCGVDKVVFNLEIADEKLAKEICPGKFELGTGYIESMLKKSIPIFGINNVWTNFVFGLEPIGFLLDKCRELASYGIVPSANVYHRDKGNRLGTIESPAVDEIVFFFTELVNIYKENNMKPFYCAKALRTSLSNEIFDGRGAN